MVPVTNMRYAHDVWQIVPRATNNYCIWRTCVHWELTNKPVLALRSDIRDGQLSIRSCQISDRAKYQISRMIIPFKSLKAFSIPFSLNYCCIWGYIERSLESVNFLYLWIQKHICYELWISIMGPMAFPFYWEMKICGKCRAKNLEAFIDWQWWAVWRGTDKFLRLVPIFGPRPNIAGIFPANFDLLAAFKKGALSRKTGEKVKWIFLQFALSILVVLFWEQV